MSLYFSVYPFLSVSVCYFLSVWDYFGIRVNIHKGQVIQCLCFCLFLSVAVRFCVFPSVPVQFCLLRDLFGIGASIRKNQKIQCLLYVGFSPTLCVLLKILENMLMRIVFNIFY